MTETEEDTNIVQLFPGAEATAELEVFVFNPDRGRINFLEWMTELNRQKATNERSEYVIAAEQGILAWCQELMKADDKAFLDLVANLEYLIQDSSDPHEEEEAEDDA